jgi:endoplasmic reticulum-Golgi intermediate compartment protein 2
MNLSHIINEFSFGPYFPDITQPLDYSYEIAPERTSLDHLIHTPTNPPSFSFLTAFMSYQYFLTIVPTSYYAPRSAPLHTNSYSVRHYTRVLAHNTGMPGIFFKFELEPMRLSIHQRTTSFVQLIIRYFFLPILIL